MTDPTSPALVRQALEPASPESCRRCGHDNPSWSAPSPLWNAVMRGGCIDGEPLFGDMVCAACFMSLADGIASGFRVIADVVNVPLQTVTPSGRVWDDATGMWDAAPGETIGRLAERILQLAPSAGLYVGIKIEQAK